MFFTAKARMLLGENTTLFASGPFFPSRRVESYVAGCFVVAKAGHGTFDNELFHSPPPPCSSILPNLVIFIPHLCVRAKSLPGGFFGLTVLFSFRPFPHSRPRTLGQSSFYLC